MRLDKIIIKNFKSIENITIKISDKTILVGPNNSGKSNILEAFNILFGERNPRYLELKESDYFDSTQEISIMGYFTEVSPANLNLLGCRSDMVNRIVTPAMQSAHRNAVLKLEISFEPYGQDSSRAIKLHAVTYYEQNEREGVGFGQGAERYRKKLCSFVLIPTLRNIDDELRVTNWTVFGKLIKEIIRLSPHKGAVINKLIETQNELNQLLRVEKVEIEQNVNNYTPVNEAIFSVAKTNEPEEILESLQILIKTGQFVTNLSRMGTGTQSSVIVAILDLYRKRRAGLLGGANTPPFTPLTILAFEEPELYLHPQGQRKIQRTIEGLVGVNRGLTTQIIFSTHSPLLLRSTDITEITRVIKTQSTPTNIIQLTPTQTQDINRVKLRNNIKTDSAEMWFADRVLLCEGGDHYILRAISLVNNLPVDEKNASIIPAGSNTKFSDPAKALERFGIEVALVTDHDSLSTNLNNARDGIIEVLREKLAKFDPTSSQYTRLNSLITSVSRVNQANIQAIINSLKSFGIFVLPSSHKDLEACYSQTVRVLPGVNINNSKERSALIIAEEMVRTSNITNYLVFTQTFEEALAFICR